MKIVCFNHKLYYINTGIFEALKEMGHQVEIIALSQFTPARQKEILEDILTGLKPDIIFTPGWSINFFDTDQYLDIVKKFGIPHVYWATEDPLFIDDVSMVFAPYSNYVFTTASECVSMYHNMGIPSSTLMFGCNPKMFHKCTPKPEFQHDIILIANNYDWFSEDKTYRRKAIQDIVAPLVNGGYDIKIYGDAWTTATDGFRIQEKYYGGYIDYFDTPSAYSSAKIVLGIQSVNTSPTQTSVRTFEIMGAGAFYLTCYTPSHENLFKNHEHLVWSASAGQTVELIDYYLKHDKERKAIAKNGQAEIYGKHTYCHRGYQFEKEIISYLKCTNPNI